MTGTNQIGDTSIVGAQKEIQIVPFSVHPPEDRVTLSTHIETRPKNGETRP